MSTGYLLLSMLLLAFGTSRLLLSVPKSPLLHCTYSYHQIYNEAHHLLGTFISYSVSTLEQYSLTMHPFNSQMVFNLLNNHPPLLLPAPIYYLILPLTNPPLVALKFLLGLKWTLPTPSLHVASLITWDAHNQVLSRWVDTTLVTPLLELSKQ